MLILTVRTDKPKAEIGLYDHARQLAYCSWEAHRKLAETLHQQIADMLSGEGQAWIDITAILVFKGPGSFTGLRIGFSAANALAFANNLPIAAISGDNWIEEGRQVLAKGGGGRFALPEYGSLPHITQPKK